MSLKRPDPGAERRQLLTGKAGAIEVMVQSPRTEIPLRGIAVVCHPHPLHGGAMSNKLAWMLASAAVRSGLLTARFNFRGVGQSEGEHDDGRGERIDTEQLVDAMRELQPSGALLLAGFSFGADIATAACRATCPDALITVAPPLTYLDVPGDWAGPACRWQLLHARDDDVVPFARTQARSERYAKPPARVEFDSGGHFFHGRVSAVRDAVLPFLAASVAAG